VAIEDRETVTVNCLPQEIISPQKKKLETQELFAPGFNLTHHLDEITKKYIQDALALTGGSLQKAAPLLGLSYRTIRYLIGKYDLNQVRKAEKRNGNGDRNPV